MGWFENQIEERRNADEQLLEESFVKAAGVMLGYRQAEKIGDDRIVTKGATGAIFASEAAETPLALLNHAFGSIADKFSLLNWLKYALSSNKGIIAKDVLKIATSLELDEAKGLPVVGALIRIICQVKQDKNYIAPIRAHFFFRNVSGTLNFEGSLDGTVRKIDNYCGAMVMGNVGSDVTASPAKITVNSLELKGVNIADAAGPLIINTASSNSTLNISGVSNTSKYSSMGAGASTPTYIATSLLGNIGSSDALTVHLKDSCSFSPEASSVPTTVISPFLSGPFSSV